MSPGQARQGQVFKWCTRCNTRIPDRRCPKCGARDSFTWAFVVYASKCPRCGKQVDGTCARCGLKAADLDLVFCHPDGSPFDPDVVGRRFERRAEDCPGVLAIRFHDMRHTHATLLLENGETERYVAERLGDTVEMIHQTYGHVTPKMRAGAVRRLAALLSHDRLDPGSNSCHRPLRRPPPAVPAAIPW